MTAPVTDRKRDPRTSALQRFAVSITAFNILGHTLLGFEQAYLTPIVAVLVAYVVEVGLEALDARLTGRRPKFGETVKEWVNFLLPAHISGLACAMLLYANSRLEPVILAVIIAITSKYLIKVRVGAKWRHFMNPSNFGIAAVLILFPWVGIAPPYHFTEWFGGVWDWAVPVMILAAGTALNAQLTRKMPLILAWVGGFIAQAVIRTWIEGTSTTSALLAVTGVAFILFTNYMITDPGTTPVKPSRQVWFGLAAAAVYGVLVYLHIVFGLFFALVIVCALRGIGLWAASARQRASGPAMAQPEITPEALTRRPVVLAQHADGG